MSLCILAGGELAALAITAFSLAWEHSVERVAWREDWRITPEGLVLAGARVKGSGAGMEPGPGARLENGWWVWTPELPPQRSLALAASGATSGGWRLCHAGGCTVLGAESGEAVTLRPCAG